jgi:hypothetical protein
LLGEAALLGGKLGLLSPEEAQKKFEAREAEARRIFAPTESWSDGAFTKFKELLGGSLPYMAAPIAAAGAVAAAPVTGPAAIAAGLGAAGLTSAAQFTGSNLARQLETGKSLDEASLGAAAAAAVPQAALDVVAFRAVPLIRQLFTSVGKEITEEAAQNLAKQGITNTIKDYAVTTGKTAGVEGLTESGQSFLERLQAGLNIADPSARAEYLDSFIGGAVLGGTLAPVGRYIERQKQVEEPLAPGQRPGESLEQTAQRLNFDIKQMTAQPEKEGILTNTELAEMAAQPNGYGQLIEYREQLKGMPSSPERTEAFNAIQAFTRELESRESVAAVQARAPGITEEEYLAQRPGPAVAEVKEEPPQFKDANQLFDLVRTSSGPREALVNLATYIDEIKLLPPTNERDQALNLTRRFYDFVQTEEMGRKIPERAPFVIRAADLNASGITSNDPIFQTLKNKDLNNPDEADVVVRELESALKRDDITPGKKTKISDLLENIEGYLSTIPGSGFYAQRTYPQPSGEGVAVAGRRAGEQPPAEGLAPSERGGVAPVTEPAEQPVSTEKVKPAPLATVKPAQPDFSNMSLEELEKAREDADKNNLQLDLAAIRKYLGEDAAKKYEGLSRRARESWWDKNATTELENESSVFRGVDEALIDEYIQAFNNFDTTSPKDLGRSVALLVRDIDKPNFIGSPSYVTLRNAVTYAKQQGWKEEEVTGAMRQRASEWAGADAKELFKNLFAEAKKPAKEGEKLAAEPKKLKGKKSLAKVAPQVSEAKFKELEAKAAKPSEAKPPEEKVRAPELQEKIDQLQGVLNKILAKYGLKDVKVNLEEGMADEGSYSGQLIKLALDLDNPVRTLRHEAIHALKELGFFTPQQWKVLTDRAQKEWIDRYLKGQKAVVDGKEMTRYDAYMKLYDGDMEAIVEESIADAFADFTKAPPPAGMMKAILNRMQNLFKAIKQAMKVGGYDTAEDVFGAVEKGELPAPPSVAKAAPAEEGEKASLRAPDTPQFKAFFGQSKIVNADGSPKLMYHGTARDITEFRPKQAGAIFVTDNPKFAETFASMSAEWMAKHAYQFVTAEQFKEGKARAAEQIKKDYKADPKLRDKIIDGLDNEESLYRSDALEILGKQFKDMLPSGPNIMPVYIRAENPFDYENKDHINAIKEVEALLRYTPDSISDKLGAVERGSWEAIESKSIQDVIKSLGFDGFYTKEVGQKNLAVYSPNQIKSATGNEGTFDFRSPDIRKSLRPLPTLSSDVTDRIKATIVPRYRAGYVERILEAISPKQFSKFRKEFINRYDVLARFDREAAKQIKLMGGKEQLADARAESAALFADLGGGLAASAMGVNDRKGGIPVYVKKYVVEKDFLELSTHNTKAAADAAAKKVPGAKVYEQGYTKVMDKAEGLLPIFQQLATYAKPKLGEPDAYSQYQFWADVKRTSKFILNPGTGKYEEKLFTQDDIKRANQIEKAFPEFVEIQKKWIAYNNGLVDFMRDTGVVSEAGAKEMKKHGDYFPLYRHLGEDDIQGPRLFTSIANVQGPKAAKGSESEVTDFFETIVRNTQSAIQAGIKNVAARRATDQAMRIGEVVKLDRPQSGPTVYRVLEDGKETYYQTRDPMFIESLKSLYQPDIPFIGLLSTPARILRNLVTKDPAFQLANMMRDSLSAYVASGFKFTPIVATLKQYAKAIADKSPEMRELRSAGVIGGYDYSQGVETSARKLEAEIRKAAKARTTMEKLVSPATSLWGALEKSSEASDSATRQEIYKKVLEQTGNEAEALYQALEIMNFNRKGRSPIIRILTAAVPFMNARIQGLDVLYRSGMRPLSGDATEAEKKRMNTFWVRGMMLMALSSMYWLLTHDDEEYKAQEQETRDNYWLFPSAGVKIPIPFEIGVMFKVIPERILEYAFGSDTGKDFLKSMSRQFMSTFAFNPIPQTFLPAVEVTTNYSFFTQRPVISPGMENISPEYQVGPNTSKVSGAIGQALNISPIKLDYLIQGYTGTMGMYAVNLFDAFFDMNSEAPKASKRLEQMPVLRRFMVDPEARGSISAYYDLKNSVDEVVRTSNFLQRSMDFENYGKYMQENVQMLAVKDYINDLEKTMKEYREMKNLVRISNMDADSKRDTLSNIGKLEQQLTNNIQMLKKQIASQ